MERLESHFGEQVPGQCPHTSSSPFPVVARLRKAGDSAMSYFRGLSSCLFLLESTNGQDGCWRPCLAHCILLTDAAEGAVGSQALKPSSLSFWVCCDGLQKPCLFLSAQPWGYVGS